MSELQSTIQINDGFTEPLRNLSKEIWTATNYAGKLSESLKETAEEFDKATIKTYAQDAAIGALQPTLKKVSDFLNHGIYDVLEKVTKKIKSQKNVIELNAMAFKQSVQMQILAMEISASKFGDSMKKKASYLLDEIKNMKKYQDMLRKYMADKALSVKIQAASLKRTIQDEVLTMRIATANFVNTVKMKIPEAKDEILKLRIDFAKFANDTKTLLTQKIKDSLLSMQISMANLVTVAKAKLPEIQKRITEMAVKSIAAVKQASIEMYLHMSLGLGHIKDVLREKAAFISQSFKDLSLNAELAIRGLAGSLRAKAVEMSVSLREMAFNAEISARGIIGSIRAQAVVVKRFVSDQLFNLEMAARGVAGSLKARMAYYKAYAKALGLNSENIKGILGKLNGKFKQFSSNIANSFGSGVSKLGSKLKQLGSMLKNGLKGILNIGKNFAKSFAFSIGFHFITGVAKRVVKKVADGVMSAAKSLRDTINNSLDEINLIDKLSVNFGDAGINTEKMAYDMANSFGESATMIGEMAAKAAQQGIGTVDFERVMKLSDRIGKVKLGETTESIANSLIPNLKSGHDAGQLAEIFGGGDVMTRNIKWKGFERALNRGNLSKALDIAEKIADESGYTMDKYEKAGNSMSQNFKRVNNVIDNIKKRIGLIYSQAFAPIIERVSKILQSDKFKRIENMILKVSKIIGNVISSFASQLVSIFEFVVDHLNLILGIAGGLLVIKIGLIVRNFMGIVGIAKLAASILWGIAKILKINILLEGIAKIIKGLTLIAAKAMAIKAIKMAGGFAAVGAAITGAWYGMYKLSGSTKSFSGYVLGSLGAIYQYMQNVFTNFFILISRISVRFKQEVPKTKQIFISIVGFIRGKIADLITWIVGKLTSFLKDSFLGDMLAELGVDTDSLTEGMQLFADYINDGQNALISEYDKLEDEIRNLEAEKLSFIDVTDGVLEAFNSEGATAVEWLKKIFQSSESQRDSQAKIATDTNKIRKINEQEEELKWLRAFSDRQITSSYNNSTSNTMNLTQNGVSQENMRRSAILNPRARAGRAASHR